MLPPYQREGHGAKLLKAMYDHSISNNDVYDITVEDPSDNFTRLRNFVDAKNCSDLMCFQLAQLKLGFDKVNVNCNLCTLLQLSSTQFLKELYFIL